MNKKIKNTLAVFSIMSCFTATSLYGAPANDPSNTQYAVPPAKNPYGEDSLNFYLGVYYTYWVPYQENTDVAMNLGSATVQGGVITPVITGQSGFKLSAGANTTYDGWMVRMNYAWFYNKPSLSQAPVVGSDYFSHFPIMPGTYYDSFKTQFQNQFNRIDAQLDRQFYAGNYIALRPWLGLLIAWDEEYLHVYQTTTPPTPQIQEISEHQLWCGVGPYAGAEGSFYFTDEFCGFISSGVGMLLSNHQMTAGAFNVASNLTRTSVLSNMFEEFNDMEPMLEASLGIRWDGAWPNWGLCVDLSWETQTYFNHARLSQVGTGNYSMQGLTLGARVSF